MYPILLNEQATLLIYVGKTEEAFAKLKSKTDYTVKAIAWVTASGSVNNGALYAESSITTE